MARNSAYNSLARRTLRRARRLKFDFGRGVISVPVIHVPTQVSPEMLVSSVFTLLHASPFQKQVLSEARKVRKRVMELEAEGYTFPKWVTDLVYGDEITVSRKTLKKLKEMNKTFLRQHAASYKGETDINKIIDMHNREVAAKRKATREKKKRDAGAGTGYDQTELPLDLDIKIENLIEEEQRYLEELEITYRAYRYNIAFVRNYYPMARMNALTAINTLINMSVEEKQTIINFWEGNGGLEGAIEKAVDRLHGLYYPEFAPQYNLDLSSLVLSGLPSDPEDVQPDFEKGFYSSSMFDFGNENETEDFSDVPF